MAGFGLGAWHLQKERLAQEQLETQRRQAALNTVQELMVTLAHHIRNANMVIGGFSQHLQKHIDHYEIVLSQFHKEMQACIPITSQLSRISR